MNKLSIFLSLIVAVAVAAFAASSVTNPGAPSLLATSGTQGYWFTLSQTMEATKSNPTAENKDDVLYLTYTSGTYGGYSAQKAPLQNGYFWNIEEADASTGGYYIKMNGGSYISVARDQFVQNNKITYFYKLASSSNKNTAATWKIGTGNNVTTQIELVTPPAAAKLPEPSEDGKTVVVENKFIAFSQNNLTVHMVDERGELAIDGYQNALKELTMDWTLTTAETYYDNAVAAGSAEIEKLIDVSAIWNDQTAIDRARKAVTDLQGQYTNIEQANSRPATALETVKTTLANAYNTLYRSAKATVITLSGLEIANGQLVNNNGSSSADLSAYWTLRPSGTGFTLQNQISNSYIALIPAKDKVIEWGVEVSPAVPAHFGIASTPTVFTIVPEENGEVSLMAGTQPFAVNDDIADITEATPYSVAAVSADDVRNALDGNSGEFEAAKQQATDFLDNLQNLVATVEFDEYTEIFSSISENISRLNAVSTNQNASAIDLIAFAVNQMNQITSMVNTSMTPLLLFSGDNMTNAKFLAAGMNRAEIWSGITTYPNTILVGPDATAQAQTLTSAMWVFEYAGNGKTRLVNSNGLYLTAPYTEESTGLTSYATANSGNATLFTLTSHQKLTYGENDANALSLTENEDLILNVANPTAMPQPSETAEQTDDETGETIIVPAGNDVNYYRIASVGAGGVISALLPGEALTHSASTIGSYWWLEEDLDKWGVDNAFIIHSIYPGYYLGADMTLSKEPCTWYLTPNGISRRENPNTDSAFNGYNAGLVVTNSNANNARALTAAAFTNAGDPNPAISLGTATTNSWKTNNWVFVPAGDTQNIIESYSQTIQWQIAGLKAGYEGLANSPIGMSSLYNAVQRLEELESSIGNNSIDVLTVATELNTIVAETQKEFNEEAMAQINGKQYRLINDGLNNEGIQNVYLAGSGSSLSLVNSSDDSKTSAWTVSVARNNTGFTFTNLANRTLGAPQANGNINAATGTFNIALNIWWHDYTTDSDGYLVDLGSNNPWYEIPDALKEEKQVDLDNDVFRMGISYGFGLENVAAPGTGLAVNPANSRLCGSDMNSPYAQWTFFNYYPTVEGIEGIDADAAAAEETDLFTIQGVRINRADAAPGVYISRRADGSAVKVIIR